MYSSFESNVVDNIVYYSQLTNHTLFDVVHPIDNELVSYCDI